MTSIYVGERDVVSVSGGDAMSYLQGQLSQDVETMAVGQSAWSLILQPQGKVDAWFRVTKVSDEHFLLDVDNQWGESLMARLKRFMLRVDVQLELETWTWHGYRGVEPDPTLVSSASMIVAAPAKDQPGGDVLAAALEAPAESMDAAQFERMRIMARVPSMGAELTEDTIPAEALIVDESASFTKGCYTGQELVARVDSRGSNTPRKLAVITGPGTAEAGDEITIDDATVATLTSTANDSDGFVALGYVKRSAFDATSATLGGQTVTVDLPS